LRRGKSNRLVWGLVIAGLVIGFSLAGWLAFRMTPRPKASLDNDGQRRRHAMKPVDPLEPLNEQETAQDVLPHLASLGTSLRARDAPRIVNHFDTERLADELLALNFFPARLRGDRNSLGRGIRLGMVRTMNEEPGLLRDWATFKIRSVKKLSDREAVLILRHRSAWGDFLNYRWWLIRYPGAWKVYDVEDLGTGLRLSMAVTSFAELGWQDAGGTATTMKQLRQALLAIATRHDANAAENHLRLAAGGQLPPRLESLRFLIQGLLAIHRNAFQDALAALDQAQRCNPDMPCLDFWRGLAHNRLGQWDRGLQHLQAYRNLLGDDPNLCREMGLSLRGVRRFAEAAQSYRKALDLNPKDSEAFLGLLMSLAPGDQRDDLGPRFAWLDNPHQNFERFAEECRKIQSAESLVHLVAAMRRIDRRFAAVDFFDALAQVWSGRSDQAVLLFKFALAKQRDEGKRKGYVREFLGTMARAGRSVQAYAASPDPTEAFRLLTVELRTPYRTGELRRLVRAHREKVPDDPLLSFYQAEVHVQNGYYQLADRAFQDALANPLDAATLAGFRASRVLARYHTGQMLSAYAEIGPRPATFQQLALLCLEEDDLSPLQALLETHAKVSPKDPEAVWFRCRLKARAKQTAEAIDLFHRALVNQPQEEQTRRVQAFLSDMLAAGQMVEGYRAAPDARLALRHLATELQQEARTEELSRLAEVHRRAHPDDPWGAYYQGLGLLEKQAWNRAVQVLGEAWKKATIADRQMFRWSYVIALCRAGRAAQAYAEVEPRKDTFNQVANLLIADAKWKELEALIQVRRAHAAEDPDLLFHDARARVGLRRPAEAIPLLLKAYQVQPVDYQKKLYVSTFVLDMLRHGQGMEAYRAVPDQVSAFRALASTLLTDKKDRELEKLLQEHGLKHADDPWLAHYLGELYLLRGDPATAEQQFAAALAKAKPQEAWLFRSALSRVKVRVGKAVDAYLQAGSETRTFEELAWGCVAQKDAGQLEALLAAHRRADPDDPVLPIWEVEFRFLHGDWEGVLKLLAEHRKGLFAQVQHRWRYQDRLVRALVRLNRPQEAVKEAEGFLKKKFANPVLLVLAYAAQGDVKRAMAAAERLGPYPFRLAACYRDDDLGPLLRRDSFQEFRKKFPEPAGPPFVRGE
jgi:tetratricopeptide (TPR) repeat protein